MLDSHGNEDSCGCYFSVYSTFGARLRIVGNLSSCDQILIIRREADTVSHERNNAAGLNMW